jgi:phage shock protein A
MADKTASPASARVARVLSRILHSFFELCSFFILNLVHQHTYGLSEAADKPARTRRTTMLHTLSLLLRAGWRAPKAQTETTFALPLLREEIALAAQAVQNARRATAVLAAQGVQERQRLDQAQAKVADIEERTVAALAAGNDALAREAAGVLLTLERDVASLRTSVAVYTEEEAKMRADLQTAETRLRDLDRGSRVVAARALGARMEGSNAPALAGLDGAEERLRAIVERQHMDAAVRAATRGLHQEGQTEAVRDKLAAAGFGQPTTTGVEDVIARLRGRLEANTATA